MNETSAREQVGDDSINWCPTCGHPRMEPKEIGCIYCGLKMDLNDDGASGKMADHICTCDKSPIVQAYTKLQAEATAALEAKDREIAKLEGYLERANWRRCDIPACNCNGYHNWNPRREEIEEPLKEERDTLKAEVERLRQAKVALDVIGPAFGESATCPACKGNFDDDRPDYKCPTCNGGGTREAYEAKLISERDEARRLLGEAVLQVRDIKATCEGLVDQQAMPDDWWMVPVKASEEFLSNPSLARVLGEVGK